MTKKVGYAFALAVGATQAQAQDVRHIMINHSQPTATVPFSDAVLAGSTLYISGQLGVDPATGKIAADPVDEVKLIFTRIKTVLGRAGLTMDDLVSVQVYCTDMGQYDLFNSIYRANFSGPLPARVMVGVSQLGLGARFEVSGIAIRGRRPVHVRR